MSPALSNQMKISALQMVPSIHYSLRRLSFAERGGTRWGWGHWWEEIECVPVAVTAVLRERATFSLCDHNGPCSSTGLAAAALGQGLVSWSFLTSSCFTLKIIVNDRIGWDFGGILLDSLCRLMGKALLSSFLAIVY